MFSESDIVDLFDNFGYLVEIGSPREETIPDLANYPKVLVNYAQIISSVPDHSGASIKYNFDLAAEDLIQLFAVQILANRSDLPTIWVEVYQKLVGKNPRANEASRGGLSLLESFPRGFDNDIIWWHSTWGVPFPIIYST